MSNAETLRTERLLLRPIRETDLPAIARRVNDPRIARNLSRVPWPYTPDHALAFYGHVRRLERGEAVFAIVADDRDGPIGLAGYERLSSLPGAEIGYWLTAGAWSRGYATEAARAVVDHAFEVAGHDLLRSRCIIRNHASRRVLEKCGFRFTGIGRCHVASLGCAPPSQDYELLRREWQRQRLERR
jgi:RimJ/RimL family protein N-acetyltransferase